MAEPTKHTPGPWEWGWRPGDDVNPGSVVSVGHPNAPERPFSVAMCPRYRGPDSRHRWDADARLIAAAPESHKANVESLRFLEELWDVEWAEGDIGAWLARNYERLNELMKANRAAIAKARGTHG